MTKEEILEYILKNREIKLYINSLTIDGNEMLSDLIYQLYKMSDEKLIYIFENGYLEYTCFKIIKRIKYGTIRDSDFFYKKNDTFITSDFTNYKSDDVSIERYKLYDLLIEEVNKLHWYDKAIFQLYYKDGYNYREISEKTGINIKSVAHNINKTKKFLKNKFKEI
jgi:DNA-directed RNA polymerase specialized sigma subunit